MTWPTEPADELRERRRREKRRFRRVVRVAGGTIGISAIVGSLLLMTRPNTGVSSVGVLWLILILNVIVVVGLAVSRPSRWEQMRAPLAQEVFAKDARSPVIYLRPFDADRRHGWYEQRIAKAMKKLGPVVTIGRPGEKLPATGYIARDYLPDGQWRENVLDLIERAELVILRMGRSAGLAWEVEQMIRQGRPDRLVVCFGPEAVPRLIGQPDSTRAYQEFCEQFGRLFPNGLPRDAAGTFLAFDHDWTARPSDALDGLGQPVEAHLHNLHRSLSRRRLA